MANAWLVRKSGLLAGKRYPVRDEVTKVGRGLDNDVVVDEAATVSAHHLEIRREDRGYKICDLHSTNGTFVNGQRIDTGLFDTIPEAAAAVREARARLRAQAVADLVAARATA